MDMAVVVKEETRKGPWTEQEDMQLACYVRLFGERRWDFIAKVSGLNRTGKSCRLRWVNYLNPGLKRGRLSPQEQRLILEFHARWGNRWSHIARKLPGRTDNEIKNYWRTHMRKRAQEKKRNATSPSPSSSSSSSSCFPSVEEPPMEENVEKAKSHEIVDSNGGGGDNGHLTTAKYESDINLKGYPMEQIWDEIASYEMTSVECGYEGCNISCSPVASPLWEYRSDSLWKM